MALSKSRISELVTRLSSGDEMEAKDAASTLDKMLYPNYGPGPRLLTGAEHDQISNEHYEAIRGSEGIDPLLQTVRDGTEFARAYAATALGAIGDPRASVPLIDRLSDSSVKVRVAAAKALFYFNESPAVSALIQSLIDPSTEVCRQAAWTLGFFRRAEAVPGLMALYERGDTESKVAALHALGLICDPQSLPLAQTALSDRVRKVRYAAKFALAFYDDERRKRGKNGDPL